MNEGNKENLNSPKEFKRKIVEIEPVKKKVKEDPLKEIQKLYFNESVNLILELLQTSSELISEINFGKTGINLNHKITKLVMKANKYKFSKYVKVEPEDRAKINIFQKQLKEIILALSKIKR